MPTPTESYIASLGERTFLKLWSYPNPFRVKGKEFADLVVVFGSEILVFSDKASRFQPVEIGLAWQRWYQRTVLESLKQLEGAVRHLTDPAATIFVDERANEALPFALPPVQDRRLHLIGVVHPDLEPLQIPPEFAGCFFDASVAGDERPFGVGVVRAKGHFVHILEGSVLEILLEELDTVSDFVAYLRQCEQAIASREVLVFRELDLLACALETRGAYAWAPLELPSPSEDRTTIVEPGLWEEYDQSASTVARRESNRASYLIDRLIEHFHREYVAKRYLQASRPTYATHEYALRLLASESRFGRRIIAAAFYEIWNEKDQHTFWATTVESSEMEGVRYVWLTYPPFPGNLPVSQVEAAILVHLQEHVFVARAFFPARLVIGIALPNPAAAKEAVLESVDITVLDGTKWDDEAQAGAEVLARERNIFQNLQAVHRFHIP
ncbi:MAG TPA: hypothetical protein VGX50_16345 [Longimicrobium sp.]|jgi:hypothetical protein|nr:hypothetical protein [Longimicrobium sp.]